jgi:hypothetical protein
MMFIKGKPSLLMLHKDEVRVALEGWINKHTMPDVNLRVTSIALTRDGANVQVEPVEKKHG